MSYIFVDVDTQIDFLYPTGALSVPGATRILPNLASLTRYALGQKIPIISTADAHLENDKEFKGYPAHCVKGCFGAARVPETLTPKPTLWEFGQPIAGEPAGQWIIEKRTVDIFDVPAAADLLKSLNTEAFVVYGVVTEICVKHAVTGLLRLGKPVILITDAIHALEETKAHDAISEWHASGCRLATTGQIIGT
jgi:nicotinamidase/pyrazinamidase